MAQCKEKVLHRDTYRVNRGPGPHFKVHSIEVQCSRQATVGDYCWQHAPWHNLEWHGATSLPAGKHDDA